MNMYWEPGKLAMPKLPKGLKWELKCATDEGADREVLAETITIPARSCSVYISVPDEAYLKKLKAKGKKQVAEAENYSDRTMF